MPLSDDSFLPDSAAAWRPAVPTPSPGMAPGDRVARLEARLDRLEAGQHTALDLVRQALMALKETQNEQNAALADDVGRLAAQLDACESALTRLDTAQRRDDETMRERLFDLGEALENVRAMTASAVRPGALRKLERLLAGEIEARAESLRAEFAKRIGDAVEAAESRSASALDALQETVWDDLTELARRFDGVADTVVKVRLELEKLEEERARSHFSECAAQTAPCEDEIALTLFPDADAALPCGGARPDVIPFPPHPDAACSAGENAAQHLPVDVGAVLTAAARRAHAAQEPEPEPPQEHGRLRRVFAPLGRVVSSAGSAVVAVCIISGMSLLAGPTLGPTLQGAPPAFAHDRAGWRPVEAAPRPVTLLPHLDPVLDTNGVAHPLQTAAPATSED